MSLGWYRPVHLRQINASDPMGKYSCGAYSAAIAIDRATLGGMQVDGRTVRIATGLTQATIKKQRGLFLSQICRAASNLNVELTDRTGQSWKQMLDALESGEGVLLNGDYGSIAEYSCQKSFDGNHSIYINHIDASGDFILTYDPLCKTARWVPMDVLKKYADDFPGPLQFATTRRTPLIKVK